MNITFKRPHGKPVCGHEIFMMKQLQIDLGDITLEVLILFQSNKLRIFSRKAAVEDCPPPPVLIGLSK